MDKRANTKRIKRSAADWLKVLVLLLDEAAALLLVILALRFFGIGIPLPVTIVIVLLLGIVIFVIHKAVIPSFRWKPLTGTEAMIGKQGMVVKPLTPVGTVAINGEYWKAESVDGNIEIEEKVEIVGLKGLTLRVKHKEQQLTG